MNCQTAMRIVSSLGGIKSVLLPSCFVSSPQNKHIGVSLGFCGAAWDSWDICSDLAHHVVRNVVQNFVWSEEGP
ncbi:hypothetical protein TcWFU_006841 [Taenia crassiceps]|uniref:Uncharacterized protein n=1 Tax=Taenia crassiceps TaxID=6207 RepID=A0ABR4Q9R8_9CEST